MYENLSLVYDQLMKDVDYKGWANYLTKIYEGLNKDAKTLLEYGCGSGSVILEMPSNLELIGVDLSVEMLSLAESKAREKNRDIRLFMGDLNEFDIGKKLDIISIPCDTLNYLNPKELKAFFKKVYKELNFNGILLFDMVTKSYLEDYIAANNFIFDTDDVFFTWESEVIDDHIDSVLTFFIKNKDKYIRVDDEQTQYIYKKNQIEELLKEAGFEFIASYEFETFNAASDSIDRNQFIAQKKSF